MMMEWDQNRGRENRDLKWLMDFELTEVETNHRVPPWAQSGGHNRNVLNGNQCVILQCLKRSHLDILLKSSTRMGLARRWEGMEKSLTIIKHHGGYSHWWENLKHLRWKGTLPRILRLLLILPPLCCSNNEWVRKIIWKGKGKKRARRQKNVALHKGRERGLSENKRTCIKRKKDPRIAWNLERNSMWNFYCTKPRCSPLEEYYT